MLAFISNLGPGEFVLVLIVAVLIFGRRLPEMAARGAIQIQKLRRGVQEFRRESGFDEEMRKARQIIEDPVRLALKDIDQNKAQTNAQIKRPFVGRHPEALPPGDEATAKQSEASKVIDVPAGQAAPATPEVSEETDGVEAEAPPEPKRKTDT